MLRLTIICCCVLAASARAACLDASPAFRFYFENDLFANTDQNYTNGLKLAWISGALEGYRDSDELPGWQAGIVDRMASVNDWLTGIEDPPRSDCAGDEVPLLRRVAFGLGQNIYTPEDITRSEVIVDDRPYAGWLYGFAAFHTQSRTRLDIVELQVGVIGPYSLAQPAQTVVHEIRDFDKPNGWSNQLESELGIVLSYERRQRWFELLSSRPSLPLGFDLIPRAGFSLGNVHDHLSVGAEARLGWNLPRNFGNAVIRPAGDAGSVARVDGLSLHVFASADGRLVLRDLFLDGNTLAGSHSVEKEHLVGDFAAGVSVGWGPLDVTLARVLRTREFEEQDGPHRFGSLSMRWRFD